jgi:phosphoenolpyruvate carboxykinase (ATP)
MEHQGTPSQFGLENQGIRHLRRVYWNLKAPFLVEQVILRNEGVIGESGPVVVNTGQHTGRSPNDKFVVRRGMDGEEKIWWGKVNQPISGENFDLLYQKTLSYLQGRDVFVQDLAIGAHPDYRIPIRVISEQAWSSLFSQNLFIRLPEEQQRNQIPEFTVIHVPSFLADPEIDRTNTSTFIALDFHRRLVLIGGSSYAGEIKKSVFTVMNYLMPQVDIFPMHCSANTGTRGDVALFFGLSGTGKTTLSSDPERNLIGDDEHGWGDVGVFNFEGGCYAKTIRLDPRYEPIIWEATHRFGSVLENVVYNPETRVMDFDDEGLTENTRGAYPIHFVPNHVPQGYGGQPENVFFLTADAFGVLPPISRLSPEQAMYYFLSGYTSKLAGTEKGLGAEPQATFSTCFGAPFLPLHPSVYAEMLGKNIKKYNSKVWLVNTGWTGGTYGVGSRFKLPYTRAMIRAALSGEFDGIQFQPDQFFGLMIPEICPGVPSEVLNPQSTWKDQHAYMEEANRLIFRFKQNFETYKSSVSAEVLTAGPSGK